MAFAEKSNSDPVNPRTSAPVAGMDLRGGRPKNLETAVVEVRSLESQAFEEMPMSQYRERASRKSQLKTSN